MTTPLVVGAGAVGLHATRQLLATPGIERVLLCDLDPGRVADAAGESGGRVVPVDWSPGEPVPDDATVLVAAASAAAQAAAVRAVVESGRSAVACADGLDAVRGLLGLAPFTGATVVVGAGLAPGLSELLAAHAAGMLDEAVEVHVARFGTTGPACRRASRRAAWGRAGEVGEAGESTAAAGSSRRLVGFPEPVGVQECRTAASGAPELAARALPGLRAATARHAMRRVDRLTGRSTGARRRSSLGAVHVEVRGRRGAARETLVLGAVDRMAPLIGAVLATAAAAVSGLVPGVAPSAGVQGLAELGPARALLADLAHRGVRAARFTG